jgi:type IV pilus assembly protein PilM
MTPWRAARAWLSTPRPTAAVEIAPDYVTAVALGRERNGPLVLGHARARLPSGAVTPGGASANLPDPDTVAEAVRDVLARLPSRPARVGLVIPDAAAKVSLVRFSTTPRRATDLARLIRWQLRGSVPFKPEEAQVAYTAGAPLADGGREYVVVAARREIVLEYERLCIAAGVRPGLVGLAAFGLVNSVLAGQAPPPAGDWLLVHAAAGYNSVGILRGEHLVCFRNRPGDGAGDLLDLVHQTVMYYEDRLAGGGLEVVRVAARGDNGAPGGSDVLTRPLAQRIGVPVEPLTTDAVAPPPDADRSVLETLAAPIGVLVRDRR